MKIGYIGAGKLGMPVAACVAQKHDVLMHDADPGVYLRWGRYPFVESAKGTGYETINDLMEAVKGNVRFTHDLGDMADRDIIFVAVQTPHDPKYEGVTPLPETTADFNYRYLIEALGTLATALEGSGQQHTVVVISTCLPGTYKREIEPLAKQWINISLVYNPYFIAMGTVIPDFLDPEFVLIGLQEGAEGQTRAAVQLNRFYVSMGISPDRYRIMSITSAEATKVFYNTFISMKLSFANIVAEACEKVGADCDDVMGAIKAAGKRLISQAYLTPGMGDGGGCHPRDNIALSHFAQTHDMSFDFFGMLMQQREVQARRFARIMYEACRDSEIKNTLWPGIVGEAFKAHTNITTGSHAVLVANILCSEFGFLEVRAFDRFTNGKDPTEKGVYLIGCAHDYIRTLAFPAGSIVIDPWGIVPDQEGVTVRRLGRTRSPGKLEVRECA